MGLLHARLAKYDLPQKMMEKGIYPYFRQIVSKQGTEVEMDGHNILMFGSNAYTGLTGDDRVIEAGVKALRQYGSGCAGSRFLNGTLDIHVRSTPASSRSCSPATTSSSATTVTMPPSSTDAACPSPRPSTTSTTT